MYDTYITRLPWDYSWIALTFTVEEGMAIDDFFLADASFTLPRLHEMMVVSILCMSINVLKASFVRSCFLKNLPFIDCCAGSSTLF